MAISVDDSCSPSSLNLMERTSTLTWALSTISCRLGMPIDARWALSMVSAMALRTVVTSAGVMAPLLKMLTMPVLSTSRGMMTMASMPSSDF